MYFYFILILFIVYLIIITIKYKKECFDIDNIDITDYIGPNYNYITKIKTPNSLGVSPVGNLFVIPKNIGGIKHYTKTLGYGNSVLGDRYFVKSGKCDNNTSVKECRDQDRWIFIDNRPKGSKAGLIPGIVNDMSYIRPLEIPTILLGSAESQPYKTNCYLRKERVIKDKSRMETRCSVRT